MRQVYNRQHPARRNKQRISRTKWIGLIAGAVALLCLVTNGVLYFYFQKHTYPNTYVGSIKVGNMTQAGIKSVVSDPRNKLFPESITLTHGPTKEKVLFKDIGLHQDFSLVKPVDQSTMSKLPLLTMFNRHELAPPISVNDTKLQQKAAILSQVFKGEPKNATLKTNDAGFIVVPGADGYSLDTKALISTIQSAIKNNKSEIAAPIKHVAPTITTAAMQSEAANLNNTIKTTLTYRYKNQAYTPNSTAIARWYVASGNSYALSDTLIGNNLLQEAKKMNTPTGNIRAIIAETKAALSKQAPLDATFTPYATTKTVTYCTALKGVSADNLGILKAKAAHTYTDIRGWSLEGQVTFKEASNGCDFTLWLAAANQMPSFGAICDSMWSCRVGPNVVVNFDRWQNASPAWQKYGGSLDEYRDMVINHETGHWIGFDHDHCAGTGQLAPVMQQQSIDLQGCKFSPWPNSDELVKARRSFGL